MAWHHLTTDRPGWTTVHSSEQEDNAREIWNILVHDNSWTENSASAVLGNLQAESYINPGQWELYQNYDTQLGMGLGQWTPATKVSDFIGGGIDPTTSQGREEMADGNKQMELLISTPSQYSTNYLNPDGSSTYYDETGLPYISNMTDFSQSNESIEDLTKLWAICWERPRNTYYASSISDRIQNANYWYNILHGSTPPGPGPTPHHGRKLPLWMYLRRL